MTPKKYDDNERFDTSFFSETELRSYSRLEEIGELTVSNCGLSKEIVAVRQLDRRGFVDVVSVRSIISPSNGGRTSA